MKHKGFLLAVAGGVAFAPAATAADLPSKAPAYIPPPPVSWTGWYIGVHAGANWQHADNNNGYTNQSNSTNATGFIGGGQIGYNWQHGNAVFGIEADGSGLTGTGRLTDTCCNNLQYDTLSNKIKWLATVRGRMGLAVNDTLVYATGGLAFGGIQTTQLTGCCNPFFYTTENSTRVGWTIGGGVEHMFTRNWIVGLEALYVDLGGHDYQLTSGRDGDLLQPGRISFQTVIGRVKVNYKF